MGLQVQTRVTCDHTGCKVVADVWAEVHHERILDAALGEHSLASLSVLDSPDLKGWKVHTGEYGKCLCPIHNKPEPKGKPVDTSSW